MKDLVAKISKIFIREQIGFVLIGAVARDLYFEQKNIKTGVRTKDVDFAILVKDWDEFNEVKGLLKKELEVDEGERTYRLMFGEIPVDLLPFGEISGDSSIVKWPGKFREKMKVLGFEEAFKHSSEIEIKETKVRIIIPEMLVALKLSSWNHGGVEREKDAVDIRYVLESVKALCPDLEDHFHDEENREFLEKYSDDEKALRS